MIKYSELSSIWKSVVSAGAVISAIAIIFSAVSWAADTKYHTLVAQELYVQKVSQEQVEGDIRQLKRDIKRLELKDEHGNASPEDRAFVQYLLQDLETLQQIR